MLALSLRLTLRSGREALVRLIVTAAAVTIGVAILLAVAADFNAFRTTSNKACWECTQGAAVTLSQAGQPVAAGRAELWNYGDDIYDGQTIEHLDVAALGPGAPLPPGISRLPAPGQFYASPALGALLRSVPRDELGDRFPGVQAGTIGPAALTGPDELVIYSGRTPAQLAALPHTVQVSHIQAVPGKQIWSPYFRDAFVVAALAFLFPILILIGTATRLAAARLEQRYAALRLVGSTTRQISVIAAADAVVSALLGVVAGLVLFTLLRPALAGTAITSARYFSSDVTLNAADYAAVLVAVPAASALAALLSLRRVRISPLGVSRRITPPLPRITRIIPLGAGVILFGVGIVRTTPQRFSPLALLGLLLIMIGLVVAGPWLTGWAARLLGQTAAGASSLLAARRLSDNPTAAFRAVRGLVLAVFLGTVTAGLLPAITSQTASVQAHALNNVLLDQFISSPVCGNSVNCTGGPDSPGGPGGLGGPAGSPAQQRIGLEGLPSQSGAALLTGLRAIPGAAVYPVYSLIQNSPAKHPGAKPGPGSRPGSRPGPGSRPRPGARPRPGSGPVPRPGPGQQGPDDGVMTCASLRQLAALGHCAAGLAAVSAPTSNLYGDNPAFTTQAIVSPSSPAAPKDYARLPLQSVLVRTASPAVLERVRTFLATHTPLSESGSAPSTFGEAVQARLAVARTAERLIDVAVALTLLVAGCSLAVAAGGGLLERRRPFSLLRLSGTSAAALYRVVLLETVLPLVVATVAAAGIAYGVAAVTVGQLGRPGSPVPVLGSAYYVLMGTGLAVSLAVILATLPLLKRMTSPAVARFE